MSDLDVRLNHGMLKKIFTASGEIHDPLAGFGVVIHRVIFSATSNMSLNITHDPAAVVLLPLVRVLANDTRDLRDLDLHAPILADVDIAITGVGTNNVIVYYYLVRDPGR